MQSVSSKIFLTGPDGHRQSAWFCAPSGPARGGVIILHAIYGLTSHMADVCTRWADEGYAALAPALFDRTDGPNVFSYDRPGANAGIAAYATLREDHVFSDVQAARDYVHQFGKVAISGFCTGGSWAWRAASAMSFDAQVNFYGSHISEFINLRQLCPTILHYGDGDHIVTVRAVREIQRRHPEVDVQIYENVGHAFFNPDQTTFHKEAADLAWKKSLEFVNRHFAP